MEELLAVLVGTGAVVFSPFLIPGLRPVAKSAIKGGIAVAEAARGVAVATSEGYREVVSKASEALKPANKAVAPDAAMPGAAAAQEPLAPAASVETAEAAQPADGATTAAGDAQGQAAGMRALNLAPIMTAINKAGQTLSVAAAGMLAQAGRQWSDLIADVQSERKASEALAVAEAAEVHVPKGEVAVPPQGPVMVVAHAPEAPAVEPDIAAEPVAEGTAAEAPATAPAVLAPAAMGDDLQRIHGIGPKVAGLLRDAGITTFEELAAVDPEHLRAILTNAGARYRVTDPTPWPGEARQLLEAHSDKLDG